MNKPRIVKEGIYWYVLQDRKIGRKLYKKISIARTMKDAWKKHEKAEFFPVGTVY